MLVSGTPAADVLSGTAESDLILGLQAHDMLVGLAGNDTLDGGPGSETLSGGSGADTFALGMTATAVQGGSSNFVDWLVANGIPVPPPGSLTQAQFSSAYTLWLEHLVERFHLGVDLDGDGEISVDINQHDPLGTPLIEGLGQHQLQAMFVNRIGVDVNTGSGMQTGYFSNSFGVAAQTLVTSTAGTDVVLDFSRAQGDKLAVSGLGGVANLASHFTVAEADMNGDLVLDTVIRAVNDASFGLTLLGHSGFSVAHDMVFV
jgi:Ca2+-binding RTX toxin-like protein